jgi:putative flippase GtrA
MSTSPLQQNKSKVRSHKQFFLFAAVGISGTIVQYILLWIGVSILLAPAALASAIGFAIGSIVNYHLNYIFTFQSAESHLDTAPRYFVVLGIGWSINIGLMVLLVHYWGWNYWFAQMLTTVIGLLWGFSGSRWWAFKQIRT